MSFDFLQNIFNRGNFARTDSPVVSIGGVDNTSATLTYDVAHFSAGALLVNTVNAAAASGTTSISGNVNVAQWGGSNVQSASFGVPTVGLFQRLDATNDAILNYAQARTSDPTAAANGSNTPMIADTLGKMVVLPGAVNDRHLDGDLNKAGVLTSQLIASQGTGVRIAVQSLLITGSGSQICQVVLSGGPSNRTVGYLNPTGTIPLDAGGAPLYITSASAALSVFGSVTTTFQIFASGYALGN